MGCSGENEGALAVIERALDGDRSAALQLVQCLQPVIQARVRLRTRQLPGVQDDPSLLSDLVQEVWAILMKDNGRQLLAYDPSQGTTLRGYVGLLAERATISAMRKHYAEKRRGTTPHVPLENGVQIPCADHTPEEASIARNLAIKLGEHLTSVLPTRGQLIFRCLYTDGLSSSETAALMNVKHQVVYNWQFRIREAAAAFLRAHD